MIRRCDNPTAQMYQHYGGRGIKVCSQWRESFTNFFKDLGTRPSPQHSLDRVNNDGNYEPTNCKWSTQREQLLNRRRPTISKGKSQYVGVYWHKTAAKWAARIRINGKKTYLGLFSNEDDAARAYKDAAACHRTAKQGGGAI